MDDRWVVGGRSRGGRSDCPLADFGRVSEARGIELNVGDSPLLADRDYLQDHQLHRVPVMPGATIVDLAIGAAMPERSLPLVARSVVFERPVDIGPHAQPLTFSFETTGLTTSVTLHRKGDLDDVRARLELQPMTPPDRRSRSATEPGSASESISLVGGEELYGSFARDGNQYGPRFQALTEVRTGPGHAVGSWRRPAGVPAPGGIKPIDDVLIDSCTHLLAAAGPDPERRPFVVSAIGRVELLRPVPATGRIVATITSLDADGLHGDVVAFGDDDEPVVHLTDLVLTRVGERRANHHIPVASTFTADPLTEIVDYWAQELDESVGVAVAPYGQLAQQLLDPASVLRSTPASLVVALVRLEDWLVDPSQADSPPTSTELPSIRDHAVRLLPNGLEVAHLNDYETDYLYGEIFLDRAYARHGVTIGNGSTVLDVGANIGLFTLWADSEASDVTVYAFEPSPVVASLLRANASTVRGQATVIEAGVGASEGTAELTVYPHSSVFSGFEADVERDRAALEAIVRNMVDHVVDDHDLVDGLVADLTADRLAATSHTCRMVAISDIIRQEQIEKIDLLKIDAEGSEQAVLRGIDDDHWPLIDQVVIEVHHDDAAVLADVVEQVQNRGFDVVVDTEPLLAESGFSNIYAVRPDRVANPNRLGTERLRARVEELLVALEAYAATDPKPLLLGLCPNPAENDRVLGPLLSEAAARIQAATAHLSAIELVETDDLARQYQVDTVHDPMRNSLGHIPYTEAWFAALGTALVRAWLARHRPPPKVLALDADDTLWSGAVAERGVEGVGLEPGRVAFHHWVKDRLDHGLIACIVSKNKVEDVVGALDGRADMPLGLDDFVGWRIGWQPKSQSLEELAAELDLDLSSFVFIDDNPVECAQVRAELPAVTTVRIPEDPSDLGPFLDHLWAADQTGKTEEDGRRTALYQQEAERKKELGPAPTLEAFVEGLGVEVAVEPLAQDDIERAAQLTVRTNQFNTTTIRRRPNDFTAGRHFTVRARDRFGDYGLVGLVSLAEPVESEALRVEAFLLSCRVLGRGVEHAVVRRIGEIAAASGASSVVFDCEVTDRNQPAVDFLASVASEELTLTADAAIAVAFSATTKSSESGMTSAPRSLAPARPGQGELFERIATEFRTARAVVAGARRRRTRQRASLDLPFVPPHGDNETAIAGIWAEVLGLDEVGRTDPLFEIGGSSLNAIEIVAMLHERMGLELGIVDLFDRPTVAQLAASSSGATDGSTSESSSGRERGAARRARPRARANRPRDRR